MTSIHNVLSMSFVVAALSLAMSTMPGAAVAQTATVTIDRHKTYQTIDGFGAAQPGGDPNQIPPQDAATSVYEWPEPYNSQIMDLAFSEGSGIGLTILRMKVNAMMESAPGQWNDHDPAQAWIMQEAVKRGPVKLMASVWSPPAWMKTNGQTTGGICANTGAACILNEFDPKQPTLPHCGGGTCRSGRLDPSPYVYQAYADFLAHYATTFARTHGVNIYAISMANEPDTYGVNWDTCEWTSGQISKFLGQYLAPTFMHGGIATKVIAPEAAGWDSVDTFLTATYNNPTALARVDIVAGHGYGGDPSQPFPRALKAGKKVWQTEDSGLGTWSIDGALHWAKNIHDGLTGAQISAWLWFVMFNGPANRDTGGLIGFHPDHSVTGSPTLWAIGNFSKFIRPGFVRIGATPKPAANVYVSAYKDPTREQLVIVAINENDSPRTVRFNVGFSTTAVPYVTSAGQNLAPQPEVSLASAVMIPARSIVTYVVPPPQTSDILWRHTDGTPMIWLGGLATTARYPGGVDNYWQIQGVGDFDGDGRSDILWRHATGWVVYWPAGWPAGSPWTGILNQNWQIHGVGDFDGNGTSDILWRYSDGTVAIWPAGHPDGTAWPGALNQNWQIHGVGDFDGNGTSDILWRYSDGTVAIWPAGHPDGTAWPGILNQNWQIHGVGDFDGNGTSDILWRYSDGTVAIWPAGHPDGTAWPGALNQNWQVHGVGDFDGNGTSDILWRYSDGTVAIWPAGHPDGTIWLQTLDHNWQIEGVGKFD